MLVMGPWIHGGWSHGDGESLGPVPFNAKTADFFRENIELPFFEFHLKGKGASQASQGLGLPDRHQPVAASSTAWPPKEARPKALYLRAGGPAGLRPAGRRRRRRRYDEYVERSRPSRCRS